MQGINVCLATPYLVFFDGLCANALAAAVFDFALVRPSLRTADAAEAARFDVCLLFFIALSSLYLFSIKKIMLDKTNIPRQNINGVYSSLEYWVLLRQDLFYWYLYYTSIVFKSKYVFLPFYNLCIFLHLLKTKKERAHEKYNSSPIHLKSKST